MITVTAEDGTTREYTINVTVAEALGIDDNSAVPGLSVYPNPSDQSGTTVAFDVQKNGKVSLQLIDLQGKIVMEFAHGIRNSGSHEIRLNTAGLMEGMYIIRLHTADGVSNAKVYLR